MTVAVSASTPSDMAGRVIFHSNPLSFSLKPFLTLNLTLAALKLLNIGVTLAFTLGLHGSDNITKGFRVSAFVTKAEETFRKFFAYFIVSSVIDGSSVL